MAEDPHVQYAIEKTNFPFIKEVANKFKHPYWRFNLPGEYGNAFVQYAVNNSYCDSYSSTVTRTDQRVQFDMMPLNIDYVKPSDFDTFNERKNAPGVRACLVVFKYFGEREIGPFFDTLFPMCFKSTKQQAHQWMILRDNFKSQSTVVPKELVQATAEYLGATMVIWLEVNDKQMRWDSLREKTKKLCEEIVLQMPAAIQYTENSLASLFFNIAKVRFGTVEEVRKLKLDPAWSDPMKNSLLHMALPNPYTSVFHFLAKKFPELINKQNIFGNTPIHQIPVLRARYYKNVALEWDELWQLPIDFSLKNAKGLSCLEVLVNEANAVDAFKALIKNEKQWKEARKYHKRKRLLTAIMHEYTKVNRDVETVVYFIEQGASIHHHENKSLLNSALRANNAKLAEKMIELGSKVTVEDIMFSFESKFPDCFRLLVKRPELSQCSSAQLSKIVQISISVGLTDVLKYLVKRGCKAGLSGIDQSAMLVTANMIAQMNRSTVMPLTYLCVDELSEVIAEDSKALETYPEEIRALFAKKELWRWALLLDAKDSDRQRRILKLYEAANNAKKGPAQNTFIFKVGSVEFSMGREDRYWRVWPGADKLESQAKYEMYYQEFYEYIGSSGHADSWSSQHEQTGEVLDGIMKDCGWPLEDKYIFLRILETASPHFWYHRTEATMPLVNNLFCIWLNRFMEPPKWYTEFVLATYGITNPAVPRLD